MGLFQRPEDVFELDRFFVILSIIIFFTALLLWPLGWLFRQPFLNKDGKESPVYRPMFTLGRYYSMILVVFSLLVYFFLRKNPQLIAAIDFPGLDNSASFSFNFFIAIPSLIAALFPIQLLFVLLMWIGKHGTKIFRIQYSLVSAALLVFLLFLIYWNLVFPGYYLGEMI